MLPGEKAADEAETRDEVDPVKEFLPGRLQPGQKPKQLLNGGTVVF